MCVILIVVFQVGAQTLLELFRILERATRQETPLQYAKPQLHLIQPRTMFGSEVKHVFVGRIGQKRTAIGSSLQRFRMKLEIAPAGNETANVQTPMRIQVVQHPVVSFHFGKPGSTMIQMGREVLAGPRQAQGPRNLARRNSERVDQHACAVADVFVLAAC